MNSLTFQLNKVRRLIKTQGAVFQFRGRQLNEFNEPIGDSVSVNVRGVYHETTSYLSRSAVESTTIRTKASPMILCLWEDVKNIDISFVLNYNGKSYTIGDIKNISEANIVADISLEEVQGNGKRV